MSAERPLVPTALDYDEEARALAVSWSDGARHLIPFPVLRRECPCATCRGEGGHAGRFASEPDLHPGEDELADVVPVGAYAVNPVWANGHSTGIYTYAHLRRLGEGSPRAG